jgi:hypothetical protein
MLFKCKTSIKKLQNDFNGFILVLKTLYFSVNVVFYAF